jgi:hypothetical protein
MAMDDLERRTIEATITRCLRSKYSRPMGVSRAEEQAAFDRGFLTYVEYPSGHYVLTSAGQEFMSGVEFV